MQEKRKVYVETSQQTEDDDYLEELWRIKDEIASRYSSFQEYCADLMRYQREAHPEWYAELPKDKPAPATAEPPAEYK